MDNTTTVQYAGLIGQLSDKARSVVRDLDPTNDLAFLRIRTKKHEIMVAPGKNLFVAPLVSMTSPGYHLTQVFLFQIENSS